MQNKQLSAKLNNKKFQCDLPHYPSIQNLPPTYLKASMKLSSTVIEQHSNYFK